MKIARLLLLVPLFALARPARAQLPTDTLFVAHTATEAVFNRWGYLDALYDPAPGTVVTTTTGITVIALPYRYRAQVNRTTALVFATAGDMIVALYFYGRAQAFDVLADAGGEP